jgi:hypothetical protein
MVRDAGRYSISGNKSEGVMVAALCVFIGELDQVFMRFEVVEVENAVDMVDLVFERLGE